VVPLAISVEPPDHGVAEKKFDLDVRGGGFYFAGEGA